MVIGLVGTTIAPWMQFYLQASIVEKGSHAAAVQRLRGSDVIVGCIFTDVVAWFIIVACAATLYAHGHHDIRDAADAAQALRPLAGRLRLHPLLRSASSTPRSSPRRSCRSRRRTPSARAWASNRASERSSPKRRAFYWLYTLLIVAGAVVILIPSLPLVEDHRPLAGGQRRGAARSC